MEVGELKADAGTGVVWLHDRAADQDHMEGGDGGSQCLSSSECGTGRGGVERTDRWADWSADGWSSDARKAEGAAKPGSGV